MRLISQDNNHVFVCGITRSGKTHFVHAAALSLKDPVLYFNIQGEDAPRQFITVRTSEIDLLQLVELLKDGAKVNLIFDNWKTGYKVVAGYIIAELMQAGFAEKKPIYVIVDECHLLNDDSLEKMKYAATAGLKKGVRLICVTQRPALADKTLYTQSHEHYIFFLSVSEKAYMKNKGIDYDQCQSEWKKRGKYSYIYFDGYKLEGRNKIT